MLLLLEDVRTTSQGYDQPGVPEGRTNQKKKKQKKKKKKKKKKRKKINGNRSVGGYRASLYNALKIDECINVFYCICFCEY